MVWHGENFKKNKEKFNEVNFVKDTLVCCLLSMEQYKALEKYNENKEFVIDCRID